MVGGEILGCHFFGGNGWFQQIYEWLWPLKNGLGTTHELTSSLKKNQKVTFWRSKFFGWGSPEILCFFVSPFFFFINIFFPRESIRRWSFFVKSPLLMQKQNNTWAGKLHFGCITGNFLDEVNHIIGEAWVQRGIGFFSGGLWRDLDLCAGGWFFFEIQPHTLHGTGIFTYIYHKTST